VKRMPRVAVVALLAVGSCLVAWSAACAQAPKPVVVVSVASLKKNLDDLAYGCRLAGAEDAGKSITFFANALSAGIDRQRPAGLIVVPKPGDFHAVAFVPLEADGLKTILNIHKEQLGEPRDAGGGLLEIGNGPRTAFVKEQNGWAFVAESKEHLSGLPQDPASLLGEMPQRYNLAAKVLIQNIPAEVRQMIVDEIKLGMERMAAAQRGEGGPNLQQQIRNLSGVYLASIDRLFNEIEEVTLGIGLQAESRSAVVEVLQVVKAGSPAAKAIADTAALKPAFSHAFMLPDAAMSFQGRGATDPQSVRDAQAMLKGLGDTLRKQIDDAPDIPADKREPVKELMTQYVDFIGKIIATGKAEGGGTLLLQPGSLAFAFGLTIPDAASLEKLLNSALALGKDIPDFPKLEMNVATLGDLKIHRLLTPPIPEPEAAALLGERLEMLIAVGPKHAYLVGGKDARGLLDKLVAAAATPPRDDLPQMELQVSLVPILRFAQSIGENPIVGQVLRALENAGKDQILFSSRIQQRQTITRFEVQEGILQAIGQTVKALGALSF
jgi:hypothetical protein